MRLKNFALVFSIILIGCDQKKEQQAQQQAEAAEVAQAAQAKAQEQKNLFQTNLTELVSAVGNYRMALDGIGQNADKAIAALNIALEHPSTKQLNAIAPAKSSENIVKFVSQTYDNFRTLVERFEETLDDTDTDNKFLRAKAYVRTMPEGKQKNTFSKGIESCDKAREWLTKYRQRRRSDTKDQVQQMKECSKQLQPTISELDAVVSELVLWME